MSFTEVNKTKPFWNLRVPLVVHYKTVFPLRYKSITSAKAEGRQRRAIYVHLITWETQFTRVWLRFVRENQEWRVKEHLICLYLHA